MIGLQFPSLTVCSRVLQAARRSCDRLVRHLDRLAEMGDRLLERRAAQSLVARLAPPFDGEVVEPGLGEMVRDDFGRDCRALGLVQEDFAGAPVQRLPRLLRRLS
jgi:hypothetical protein